MKSRYRMCEDEMVGALLPRMLVEKIAEEMQERALLLQVEAALMPVEASNARLSVEYDAEWAAEYTTYLRHVLASRSGGVEL